MWHAHTNAHYSKNFGVATAPAVLSKKCIQEGARILVFVYVFLVLVHVFLRFGLIWFNRSVNKELEIELIQTKPI